MTDYHYNDPHTARYLYASVGTLGDFSGAETCSVNVAKRWGKARQIVSFSSFEQAANAVKCGTVAAMLVPAAYPRLFNFIQDRELTCDRVFTKRIPALVLAGTGRHSPATTDRIYFHPATEPLLEELHVSGGDIIAVQSNAEAARSVADKPALTAVAITNALCASFYRLTVFRTLRAGIKMPWIVFVKEPKVSVNVSKGLI